MTAGGSSLPEVQRVLSSLAIARRCAEAGTAFGEGAAALALTARSVVTVDIDRERLEVARKRLADFDNVEVLEGDWKDVLPTRAPFDLFFLDGGSFKRHPDDNLPQAVDLLALGGMLVLDDFTPGRDPDPARAALHNHPELVVLEWRATSGMNMVTATRVTAASSDR